MWARIILVWLFGGIGGVRVSTPLRAGYSGLGEVLLAIAQAGYGRVGEVGRVEQSGQSGTNLIKAG